MSAWPKPAFSEAFACDARHAALRARAELMLALMDDAAAIARRHYQSATLAVDAKADDSPVTIADREIESALRARILAAFPRDSVLGEEHGETRGPDSADARGDIPADIAADSGGDRGRWRWIIDPIDGTVSFAAGVPLFATLVGLEHECEHTNAGGAPHGRIRAGVCAMHALGERVWAVEGEGAWWDRVAPDRGVRRERAKVSRCAELAQALVCTTGLEYFERAGRTDALVAVARRAKRIRGWSDCYGGMLVATGRADAWFDPVMHAWDSGPFPVILAEAGGVFTDFSGSVDVRGGSAVAAPPALHAELLRVIAQTRDASRDA